MNHDSVLNLKRCFIYVRYEDSSLTRSNILRALVRVTSHEIMDQGKTTFTLSLSELGRLLLKMLQIITHTHSYCYPVKM